MAAIKALQQWCKIQCEGYRDVTVSNMTTSFRDGLAFCALIHKFRPDLINFESLSKDNVYYNNHLAFRVAEEHLGIPALLDAEDMVALPVPDRLSILTYVSQYYNYFNGRSPIGGVGGGVKRHAEVSKEVPSEKKNLPVVAKNHNFKTNTENHPPKTEMPKNVRDNHPQSLNIHTTTPEKHAPATPARQAGTEWHKRPGTKCVQTLVTALRAGSPQSHRDAEKKTILVETSNKSSTLKSECTVCGNHVHLVQRHLVDGKLYHRNCFKCSVCYGTLKSGAFKLEVDPGSLVCSVHQHAQTAFNPTVKPFKNSGVTLSEPTPKSETAGQPSSQRFTSLSTPIMPVPRPANLRTATQSWTASAQRTQAARQKFFQSCGSAADHRPTARQPSEISTDQNAGLKVVDQDGTNAPINRKLPEGNRNNNNALNSDTGTPRQLITSDSSSWRQELHSRGVREMKSNQAAPSSPAISCSLSTKESLYRSAISKERTRPPSLQLSTAKAQDVQSCEALADLRSMPKAPNGPRLKAQESVQGVLLTLMKQESDLDDIYCSNQQKTNKQPSICESAQNTSCTTPGWVVNSPIQTFSPVVPCVGRACGYKSDCATSSCVSPSQSCHGPSSPKQSCRWPASTNNWNETSAENGLNETRSPTIKTHHIPADQITKELQDIEYNLNDLENEGVELEWRLRVYEEEGHGDLLMDPLMVDWFNLIRKKQSYIRRESELMYIMRTQDLEEQQPGVEGELRRLINKPEHLKSLVEKRRESELLNRLMEIVNDRNAIVEGLEEDRIREGEEDQQLNEMMQRLGLQKFKNKRKSSFLKLFRLRSKKASVGE
ncbi:MICAL-like protein 2a [Triplophysa rosa]|uniref:Molecule interacting with CasL-like 2a n=1 Tax=Triplophysa rosa TaxID=992332 RepID=A0A9W7WIR0_TRIRA|nr:MICAL-like protein 2a [Triplophysa rosa]KAI7803312.1 molecule interacting with CasL-like 2a [Triplophysa rosa]